MDLDFCRKNCWFHKCRLLLANRSLHSKSFRASSSRNKRFLFSPPPPHSIFFGSRSNFQAITRLETLATQVTPIDRHTLWEDSTPRRHPTRGAKLGNFIPSLRHKTLRKKLCLVYYVSSLITNGIEFMKAGAGSYIVVRNNNSVYGFFCP